MSNSTVLLSMRFILLLALYSFQILIMSSSDAFILASSPSSDKNNKNKVLGTNEPSNHKRHKTTHDNMASVSFSVTPLCLSPDDGNNDALPAAAGRLKQLKQKEAELSKLLAAIRKEKLSALQSRPLKIGIVGFGRFGQFIARSFRSYGQVVVTSRSDYTEIAQGMGVTYVPLSHPETFFEQDLDVVVLAVSILSFESTLQTLLPHLQHSLKERAAENNNGAGPLFVDVLSVKEHPRQVMLDLLPPECDILCTHPMFGPDSGKDGWHGLNFVYEKTRIDKVVLASPSSANNQTSNPVHNQDTFVDNKGTVHSIHEDSEAHVEGMDRMERFLSIWEEEGCRMVSMSCKEHDTHAANSQFITHLMGRILGAQGLARTPIDTKGFESVLNLVGSTTADSFDLFYGLYKYNQNALDTIVNLRTAMDDVVENLKIKEKEEKDKK